MMDHWSLKLLSVTPKTGMEKNTTKEIATMQRKNVFLRRVRRDCAMPERTVSGRGDINLRGEESFCLLFRELPDMDDDAIPHNGWNSAHAILSRWLTADITAASALDNCTAALVFADCRMEDISRAAAERAIRRENLEGGHRKWGKEIEWRNR